MLIAEKLGLILQTFSSAGNSIQRKILLFLPRKWTEELNARTFMMIASQGIISNNIICEVICDPIGSF